jgi:hypothetical protein
MLTVAERARGPPVSSLVVDAKPPAMDWETLPDTTLPENLGVGDVEEATKTVTEIGSDNFSSPCFSTIVASKSPGTTPATALVQKPTPPMSTEKVSKTIHKLVLKMSILKMSIEVSGQYGLSNLTIKPCLFFIDARGFEVPSRLSGRKQLPRRRAE